MLQRGNFILLLLFFLVTPFSPYLNRFRTLKDEALRLKGGSSITAALTQQDKTKLLVGKCAAIMQVYNPHPSLLSFLLIYFIFICFSACTACFGEVGEIIQKYSRQVRRTKHPSRASVHPLLRTVATQRHCYPSRFIPSWRPCSSHLRI